MSGSNTNMSAVGMSLGVLMIPLSILILVVGAIVGRPGEDSRWRDATSVEVAEYLGLHEGVEYPAVVGSSDGVVEGMSAEFFLGSGSVEVPVARQIRTINVDIDGDSVFDPMFIPEIDVRFEEADVAEASVAFELNEVSAGTLGRWRGDTFVPSPELKTMTVSTLPPSFIKRATITLSPTDHVRAISD